MKTLEKSERSMKLNEHDKKVILFTGTKSAFCEAQILTDNKEDSIKQIKDRGTGSLSRI